MTTDQKNARAELLLQIDYLLTSETPDGDKLSAALELARATQDYLKAEEVPPAPDGVRWGYATSEHAEFWQGAGSDRQLVIDCALEAARDEGEGAQAWIHEGVQADPAAHVQDYEQAREHMQESAVEQGCPDEIEDPFDFRPGAKEAFEAALTTWARTYVKANWWEPVGSPERVEPELLIEVMP